MTDPYHNERIPLITGSPKGISVSRNTIHVFSSSSSSSSSTDSYSSSTVPNEDIGIVSSPNFSRTLSSSSILPSCCNCCIRIPSAHSSSSSSPSYRNTLRVFLSLPWLPSSVIPPTVYPFSRYRHRLYEAFSSPWSSRLGIIIFWINALAILAYVVLFSVNSFEYFRRREIEGLYGTPEFVFDTIDAIVIGIFTVTYLVRALCVTAIPDTIETRLFRAAATLRGVNWEVQRPNRNLSSIDPSIDPPELVHDVDEDEDDDIDRIGLLDLDGTKAIRKGAQNSLLGLGSSSMNEDYLYTSIARYYTVDNLGYPMIYNTSFRYYCGIRSTSAYYSMHQPAPLSIVLWRAVSRFLLWSFNFYNIIDVLTLIPYYIELWNEDIAHDRAGEPLRVLRFLCLLRLLRLISDTITLRLLRRAALQSMDSLWGSFFLMVILIIFLSAAVFLVEHGDYDPTTQEWMRSNIMGDAMEPSPFRSILHSLYWTIITMTTCGYGDMVPTSPVGRFLAICTIGLGLLVLALPATVVGLNFTIEYEKYRIRTLAKVEAQREREKERIRQKKEKERTNTSPSSHGSSEKRNNTNTYRTTTKAKVPSTIDSSTNVPDTLVMSPLSPDTSSIQNLSSPLNVFIQEEIHKHTAKLSEEIFDLKLLLIELNNSSIRTDPEPTDRGMEETITQNEEE